MKQSIVFIALFFLLLQGVKADEGMWLVGNLHENRQVMRTMKALGLELNWKQLHHPKKSSLSKAVVSFGGFCSGVVVSADGLVFTNHHCGFNSIRQHSTFEHNYLQDGFVAMSREEELPNPELYVRFLLRTENVTEQVLKAAQYACSEQDRLQKIDSIVRKIEEKVVLKDSTCVGIVDAYYAGNEYWLSIYRDYDDVRLVFAPPSSIGKFGWDTDNWMWPRHTGDFCVFRIYADEHNRPASYSPANVPYRPEYVAPISLAGYEEGSFCMTLGYPGNTERYLSSYGIEEMMNGPRQAAIDMRGIKQSIWKREMDKQPVIRMKYASKYAESSNYWKSSIGMNRSIKQRKVLEKKRKAEETLRSWIYSHPDERKELLYLLTDLELAYGQRRVAHHAASYFAEAFFNGPELIKLAMDVLNFDAGSEVAVSHAARLREQFELIDWAIDKTVMKAMFSTYRSKVPSRYLPAVYAAIDTLYDGSIDSFVDTLYARTQFSTWKGLTQLIDPENSDNVFQDPAVQVCLDCIEKYYELNQGMASVSEQINAHERRFNAAMRRMYADRHFYPDANFTMRLSYGTIGGYAPYDGVTYDYRTTVQGILEKVRVNAGDPDFAIQPQLYTLLTQTSNFGPYANREGSMNVCFISNNDITGGNSGSAMFNGKGELLGLAFDGNWEAMSSDVLYDADQQRCIGVDVRYMLFIIEKYAHASHLLRELQISPSMFTR